MAFVRDGNTCIFKMDKVICKYFKKGGKPFPCHNPQSIMFFFANRSSGGSSFIARKTGQIFTFEDLYKGIPSVLKSKVKLCSLVRNPPLSLYLLYTVPSTMSRILEEQFVLFLNC